MKTTGIIRRMDDLGRIVIPKEIRRIIRAKEGDPFEILVEGDIVMFHKYNPSVTVASALKNLKEAVDVETDLSCRVALLASIFEMEERLKLEAEAQ